MAAAGESCRFSLVEDTDLNELLDAADSKNTKRQIKYAVNILSDYALAVDSSLSTVEALAMQAELDSFLRKFYAAVPCTPRNPCKG